MPSSDAQVPSARDEYLEQIQQALDRVRDDPDGSSEAAAQLIADTFIRGGLLHVFGTGHSHLLALELFYRAGGFAAVSPILVESLMLHESASGSTQSERGQEALAEILSTHAFAKEDTLLVMSNSGGNDVVVGLARHARRNGVPVIGLTSLKHAMSHRARSDSVKLHELSDVVLDNYADVGDAAVGFDSSAVRVGPTSTVIGAAILNGIMARCAEILAGRGYVPEIFASSNVAGGDEINETLILKYRERVRAL